MDNNRSTVAQHSDNSNQLWKGLAGLVLVQLVLVAANIGRDGLWLDEMTSLWVATGPLDRVIAYFREFPEQHPFYYVLLKGWMLLGQSETILRSFSALFALLSTFAFYSLARELVNERVARVASVVFVFSPYLLYYGQEGRMYTLLLFLAILSTLLFFRWTKTPRWGIAVAYCLVATLAVYTHIVAVFVVISHVAWVALSPRARPLLLKSIALGAVVALMYSPWLLFLFLTPPQGQDWKTLSHVVFGLPYTALRWAVGYSIFMANFGWKEDPIPLLVADAPYLITAAICFAFLVILGLRALLPFWKEGPGLALSLLFVPALLALLASPFAVLASERYLIASFPGFALLVAAGLTRVWSTGPALRRNLVVASFVLVTAAALGRYYWHPDFGRAEWREAAANIAQRRLPGDQVLLHSSAGRQVFVHYSGSDQNLLTTDDSSAVNTAAQGDRVWVVISHAPDQGVGVLERLAASHEIAFDTLYARDVGIRVRLMVRRG